MWARAMMPAVRPRFGGEADHGYMVRLAANTFQEFGDYRAIIEQWLDTPRVASLVLAGEGERFGFALIARHRRLGFIGPVFAELVAIIIESEERGRGLGTLLLEAAEETARSWKAREMRLHTAVENTAARGFFGAAGYRESALARAAYPNGQPALELRRSLP